MPDDTESCLEVLRHGMLALADGMSAQTHRISLLSDDALAALAILSERLADLEARVSALESQLARPPGAPLN
jgi:hypothetical protein